MVSETQLTTFCPDIFNFHFKLVTVKETTRYSNRTADVRDDDYLLQDLGHKATCWDAWPQLTGALNEKLLETSYNELEIYQD